MEQERKEWIERFFREWKGTLAKNRSEDPFDYSDMPFEVAVDMGLELVSALRERDYVERN